jgi:hypothetical protein
MMRDVVKDLVPAPNNKEALLQSLVKWFGNMRDKFAAKYKPRMLAREEEGDTVAMIWMMHYITRQDIIRDPDPGQHTTYSNIIERNAWIKHWGMKVKKICATMLS